MNKLVSYSRRAVLKNYANFSGRDDRPQYWWFVFGILIVYLTLNALSGLSSLFAFALVIFALGMLIPSLAAATRRLHDTGRSGWWQVVGLVPIIGAIVLAVLCAQRSQPQANAYGPLPSSPVVSSVGTTGFPPPPPPPPPLL